MLKAKYFVLLMLLLFFFCITPNEIHVPSGEDVIIDGGNQGQGW
jgi:hypothetical protein